MYNDLLQYCKDEKDTIAIQAVIDAGNVAAASRMIGMSERGFRRRIAKIKARATTPRQIVGDLDTPTGSPFVIKGTSTLYDAQTGEAKIAWVKTQTDRDEQLKQILESFKNSITKYKPVKLVKAPKKTDKDILVCYPMGDPHLGMYAWHEESGEDFDCDIAEKDLRKAMAHLIDKAPPSETCIILNLGDFFHSDGSGSTTTKGTKVDVDGRWGRVLDTGITLMMDCVHIALQKHKQIIVKNNTGNHDKETSQVLSLCMKHAFKDNPRVTIHEPSNPFFIYEFGKNMIFSTHGDAVKPKQAQGMIANYYPEAWGRTEHRYALFGHFHHEDRKEENGLIVEVFNTLASSDAWHHASGYRSKRNMKCLVLDKYHGEIERYTFSLKRETLCDKKTEKK